MIIDLVPRNWSQYDEWKFRCRVAQRVARRGNTAWMLARTGIDFVAEAASNDRRVTALIFAIRNEVSSPTQLFNYFAFVFRGEIKPRKAAEHLGLVVLAALRADGLVRWNHKRLVLTDAGWSFLEKLIGAKSVKSEREWGPG